VRYVVCSVIVGIAAGLCGPAEAGFMTSFTANGSAFAPAPSHVRDTVNVPLYLRWDGTGQNSLAPPIGLTAAALAVGFTPVGIVNVIRGAVGMGWSAAPPASTITRDNGAGTATIQTGLVSSPPYVTETGGAVLVGTCVFQGVAAGSALLTLLDPNTAAAGIIAALFPRNRWQHLTSRRS